MADIQNNFEPYNASFRSEYAYDMSKFYTDKMLKLIGEVDAETETYPIKFDVDRKLEIPLALKGYVPNGNGGVRSVLPIILMHRIDTLKSEDGHRLYEFLIEYDTDSPSVGIYYGCRGVTVDGFDHAQEIEHFRHDFKMVYDEMCRVLNNTFLDKDFSYRFKFTDNANDGTYWLFWITLNKEEDIYDVGVKATTIIRNVFKRYLDGEVFSNVAASEKQSKEECICSTNETYNALLDEMKYYDTEKVCICFTNETFQGLLDNMKYYHFGGKIEDKEKSKKAQELFKRFLEKAQQERIMIKDPSYECAYKVLHAIDKEECSNADFVRMMYAFFDYLYSKELFYKKENQKYINLPWEDLRKVFLDKDGNAFPESIKTQLNSIKKSYNFETEIETLKEVISGWLDLYV